ncbi:MAG TPA: hypothetical protein PL001_13290, partial [Candidatus Kryptobacter bacterium]|nr:hypothetical protein [Candidatus Kryptobacter bacterium]
EHFKNNGFDKKILKEVLEEIPGGFNEYDKETKRRINHLLFSGIVSYFTRGSDVGELEIRIRGAVLSKRPRRTSNC